MIVRVAKREAGTGEGGILKVGDRWFRAVWWARSGIGYIDQRLLPHRFELGVASSTTEVAHAITDMAVRGAPTIGVMAAYGLAMASRSGEDFKATYNILSSARPTAVNLKIGLDAVAPHYADSDVALEAARAHDEAEVLAAERIGEHGAALIKNGATISTHCNAGWLATQDWGTALSPVYKAVEAGNVVTVIVDETRPRLQGSRLTAWELAQYGIEHRIVADGATASILRRGEIDVVITGADRVAANGDAANKIGTYPLALAAQAAGVPFYIAAPTSTIDTSVSSGDAIPIEERSGDEVLYIEGATVNGIVSKVRVAPQESLAVNPAFDITPAALISGLITDAGIVPASAEGIRSILR